MMKKLFYGLLCLLTFAGCGKDSGVEKEGKDDKPTPEEVTLELSVSDLVFEAAGGRCLPLLAAGSGKSREPESGVPWTRTRGTATGWWV